jgi:dTDP-D-glucose 4,6-dehydratase
MLSMLVQQIAPHIHRWNRSAIFSVEKLRRHVGWEPELPFARSVERTYRWYQSAGLDTTQTLDFGFEDQLIRLSRERRAKEST